MSIAHLLDDSSPGGVVRFLDLLTASAELGPQEVVPVRRGSWIAPLVEADVIVSHLSISWRNLPLFMALRAKYPSTPLIHVEHSYSEGFAGLYVKNRRRFNALLRVSYSLFDRVVAVSEGQADWLLSEGVVSQEALRVISPVVALEHFSIIPAQTGPVHRIGAIGRLDSQKGFDVLITAFRQSALAGMELSIYGDGPERAALEALAEGDNRIRFHGFADPVEAMSECDVIAMPSRYEPFGLVCLEARASGRMVLTSGVDGLADQVNSGAVTVGADVEAWSEALRGLKGHQNWDANSSIRQKAMASEHHCICLWQDLMAAFQAPVNEHMVRAA